VSRSTKQHVIGRGGKKLFQFDLDLHCSAAADIFGDVLHCVAPGDVATLANVVDEFAIGKCHRSVELSDVDDDIGQVLVHGALGLRLEDSPQDADPIVFEIDRVIFGVEFDGVESDGWRGRVGCFEFNEDFFEWLCGGVFFDASGWFEPGGGSVGAEGWGVGETDAHGGGISACWKLLVRCEFDSRHMSIGIIDLDGGLAQAQGDRDQSKKDNFHGLTQEKLAASSMLPEPLYFATCG
jgi:hypothetical protein